MSAARDKMYVAVVGMPDCGKSTFIKHLVKHVTKRDVAVDSFCDEQQMDMTIRSAQLVLRDPALPYDIVFLDCPGHIFEYEMEALSVISKAEAVVVIENRRQDDVVPYSPVYENPVIWKTQMDKIERSCGKYDIPHVRIVSHCAEINCWNEYDALNDAGFPEIYDHLISTFNDCHKVDPWETARRITSDAVNKLSGDKVAMCSFGKDSILLVELLKSAGVLNKVLIEYPNSGYDLPGISAAFRESVERRYGIKIEPFPVFEEGWTFENHTTHDLMLCKARMLTDRLSKQGYTACFTGIRRDEEGTRAKEKFFSPRGEDGSYDCYSPQAEIFGREIDGIGTNRKDWKTVRVNPLLDLTENDVWRLTRELSLPVCSEYFSAGGKRYRSLGDWPITTPIASSAATIDEICDEVESTLVPERACRAKQDNCVKYGMEKLRKAGFF